MAQSSAGQGKNDVCIMNIAICHQEDSLSSSSRSPIARAGINKRNRTMKKYKK
jgi:hypothetical protein